MTYEFTETKHTHYLVVKSHVLKKWVVGSSFFAPNDEAAGKIARATVRTWVAATKHRGDAAIKREDVTLHRYPKETAAK